MKVLIDTNVLVSAVLRDRAPEEVLLFVIGQPDFDWIASSEILLEYREVLRRRRFGLPVQLLERWDAVLDGHTTLVESPTLIEFPRDQGDAKFLSCALNSKADILITGDRDFEEARKLVKTTILSVSAFKRLFIK